MDEIDPVYLRLRALQYRLYASGEDDAVRAALFTELAVACEQGDSRWEKYLFWPKVTMARSDPSVTPRHEASGGVADY